MANWDKLNKEFKFSEIIILPYWRTVGSKINRFHLYQGDIFKMEGPENSYTYIVRYNEKEFCFMIAHTDRLQDEKLWKRDIWFRPNRDWWELFQEGLVYLGNEYVNPELLEEK